MGERIDQPRAKNGQYSSFSEKLDTFAVRTGLLIVLFAGSYVLYQAGAFFHPQIAYADREVPVEVIHSPVLDRIASCESGNTHYDKNGQVIVRANTNKTVDIGRYQINSVWSAQAHKLGLDLTKDEDNKEMAEWIYLNVGTSPWSASQKCWHV